MIAKFAQIYYWACRRESRRGALLSLLACALIGLPGCHHWGLRTAQKESRSPADSQTDGYPDDLAQDEQSGETGVCQVSAGDNLDVDVERVVNEGVVPDVVTIDDLINGVVCVDDLACVEDLVDSAIPVHNVLDSIVVVDDGDAAKNTAEQVVVVNDVVEMVAAVNEGIADIRSEDGNVEEAGDVEAVNYSAAVVMRRKQPRATRYLTETEPRRMSMHDVISAGFANSDIVRVQSRPGAPVRSSGAKYDAAIADAEHSASYGIFDAQIEAQLFTRHENFPPGVSFDGFATRTPKLDRGGLDASISQLLPHGGTAEVFFTTDYLFNRSVRGVPLGNLANPSTLINPQYQPSLEFSLVQPLLRGHGKEVTCAPIRIARTQANLSAWRFKEQMQAMVRSIEAAYWELYAAQKYLATLDTILPEFAEITRVEKLRESTGQSIPPDVARSEAELLEFQGERIQALAAVAQKEAILRNLLGMPPVDGHHIVLVDEPLGEKIDFDYDQSFNTALSNRPDVMQQRLAMRVAQLELVLARNAVKPQLDIYGLSRFNGLGGNVGPALELLAEARHVTMEAGVTLETPWQRRTARGELRASRMKYSRENALLRNLSLTVSHELASIMRDIVWSHEQYEVAQQRVQATKDWGRGARRRFEVPPAGTDLSQALDRYLRTLRRLAIASNESYRLLANYNIAIARMEESQGTLLQNWNVSVAGDPTDETLDMTKDLMLVAEETVYLPDGANNDVVR